MPYPPNNADTGATGKHHFHGLDHLRAFAILFVFLYHYQIFGHPDWEENISQFGWTGVDLFFVLSGYLIAGQLFASIKRNAPIHLREFFIKRFFRIIPAYLVILTLYSLFPLLRERDPLSPLWRYLTFTLNFGLDLRHTGTFTHAWSLCVEEQFYLLLPLILLFSRRFGINKITIFLLPVLFIAGFFIRAWNWDHLIKPWMNADSFMVIWHKFMYYPTYNRLDGLLVGVGIAALFTFYPQVKSKVNPYSNNLLMAGLAVLTAAYFLCKDQATFNASVFGFPLIALGYGTWVMAAVCPACVLYRFNSTFTSRLAALSYSIYLVHKMMIHTTQLWGTKAGMDINSNLMFALCIITTVCGALVLRYGIEKPALKVRNLILHT